MTTPDFSKVWATSTPLTPYVFDDADYLDGWEFLGEIPPDRRMFDAWQNQADTKMQWLYQNTAYLLRQNKTAYDVGDIAFSANLPSSIVLQCTTAGTTAATEPDFSGATVGGTVTDGSAVWTYMPLGTLSREITPAFNHRDVIITSGTYTAPVTGWYRITVKGGGGGGARSSSSANVSYGGGGGGEGGTTIAYEYMNASDTATVVIGAGGTGGNGGNTSGANGGDSTVTVNSNTYMGKGGGGGQSFMTAGAGGIGTIYGASGKNGSGIFATVSTQTSGGSGGGAGGGLGSANADGTAGTNGGGGSGGGGATGSTTHNGADGGNGYVWIEYFDATI